MEKDETLSVSKGVFVFKNNFRPRVKNEKRKKKTFNGRDYNSLFSSNLWYHHFYSLWNKIEDEIDTLNDDLFSSVLGNLIDFVKTTPIDNLEEIPTAALFTGINMPDHGAQFTALSKHLKETTPHVACLHSQDCQNIKHLMENMINQFINIGEIQDQDDEMLEDTKKSYIKKTQMNMSLLQCWYNDKYKKNSSAKKSLIIIIPDFESFNPLVIQRFILILSCYMTEIPFILIFGIATDMNTLHNSLPYKVSSKIRITVFNSQRSIEYLNNVLEKVFFSSSCPFQLGGNVFNLFMELFLFYDLSVKNFIQNIKYACADHFANGNAMTLCCLKRDVCGKTIKSLTEEDLKSVRKLPSFSKLVEREPKDVQVKLLIDDVFFSRVLFEKICEIQTYITLFHLLLKCLLVLVEDLPRAPLGKKIRELYAVATTKRITQTADYKECIKLLNFQSKNELSNKLSKIKKILFDSELSEKSEVREFLKSLRNYLKILDNIDTEIFEESIEEDEALKPIELKATSRGQFRKKLLELTKTSTKSLNRYEKLREEIITTLSNTFEKYLGEPESYDFHEIFFYNNKYIKNYIIGSHRSATHNALNDPYFYLRCDCCEIENPVCIKPTMPDICIAYKLHLEYGKMINLYDWLQAFLSIVDPDLEAQESKKMLVKPELQARFTQAVAELEHLGFIKSSKRKTDHVQRLTWGG